MSKPFPALCKDCKFAAPEERSEWTLRCHNPIVNAKDEWALASNSSSANGCGTSCREERSIKWFAECGMKGKLWTAK